MYTAHRDGRFYYVSDVIEFIEERQCSADCIFAYEDPEFAMCFEVTGDLLLEEPSKSLDDAGSDGVVCTKQVRHEAHPDQQRLI